jgi:hypothetical protein
MTLNFALLLIFAAKRTGGLDWGGLFREMMKVVFAASIMVLAVYGIESLIPLGPDRSAPLALLRLALMLTAAFCVYFAAAFCLRINEAVMILSMIRGRLSRMLKG